MAAGMAGGSADAAAALRLAMAIAPGRAEEVDLVAAGFGADVPSQLLPGVAVGSGAGEIVERFEPLGEHAFVVLPSEFALSTPDVFREADRLARPRSDAQLAHAYLDVTGRADAWRADARRTDRERARAGGDLTLSVLRGRARGGAVGRRRPRARVWFRPDGGRDLVGF